MYRYFWEVIKVRINLFDKTAMVIRGSKEVPFNDYLNKMGKNGWKLKRTKDLHSHFPKDPILPKGLVLDIDRELIWINKDKK